jgi:succinate dehydrogenase / fumarate reductase cytochrome b subunit
MGWSGHIWFCRWKVIGTIYTTVIILMFAAVALAFAFGYVPCDMQAPACGGCLLG